MSPSTSARSPLNSPLNRFGGRLWDSALGGLFFGLERRIPAGVEGLCAVEAGSVGS